jgi:hypothetical protein
MSFLALIILICAAGFLLYLVNKVIPMNATLKTILNVVVCIVCCIWCLDAFGVFHILDRPIPRVR